MENGDLIELFYREPAEARVWLDAPEPGKLFVPRTYANGSKRRSKMATYTAT